MALLAPESGRSLVYLAWTVFFFSVFLLVWRPNWGICLLLLLTLVADPVLAPWYPMVSGFSARESIFFVADWLIVSPLECLLLVALARWAVDTMRTGRTEIPSSLLVPAAVAFTACLLAGFMRGAMARGNINVALWELRAPSYVLVVLLLTIRYIRTKADIVRLTWLAMLALAIEAVWMSVYVLFEPGDRQAAFRAFSDHATSVHANSAIVLMAAAWLYRASPTMRFGLPLSLPPLVASYLANQRRAAFLGLAVACGLLAAAGLRVNGRLVRRVVPIAGVLAAVWIVLAWNNPGPLGLPARTVKSIFDSTNRSMDDRESDFYRVLEDMDIISTIRSDPWTGVGFGRPFNLAVPLPAIPFVWSRYITHNAVLWIWVKTGVGGFLTLLFLWGVAIATGAATSQRVHDSDLGAIVITATLFVVMHAIYAFVDMAWDLQSTVYLGASMGLIVSVDRLGDADRRNQSWSPPLRRRGPSA